MTHLIAIDQGTTSTRAIVFDAELAPGRQRAAGAAPDLSGAGLGRARSGGDLGERASRPCARRWRRRASPRKDVAGDRHHQPARDHDRLGPRHRQADPQRHRLAGPAHRGRLRARCARPATRRRSRRRPGCCSIRISPRTKIAWLLDNVDGRARGGASGPARVRHGRHVPAVAADRRARCTRPTPPTPRAPCCSTSARGAWDEELAETVRRAGATAAARCATAPRSSARRCPICSAARSAFSASPATSRRRPSGRAASRPA